MFNNRGGWGDRGGWRGNGCSSRGGGRGNFGNQFGAGFRGGSGWGTFRGGVQGMGFSGHQRGFNNRGFFSGDDSTFRGKGNGRGTRSRRGNFSAGDQSLRNFGMNNIEEFGPQGCLDRVKGEPSFQQNDQHLHSSMNSSNLQDEEKINQSPDISSSTASPEKTVQPTASSLIHADSCVPLRSLSSTSPSQKPIGETANAPSRRGVVKCEPCDVGIVGAEVRFVKFRPMVLPE